MADLVGDIAQAFAPGVDAAWSAGPHVEDGQVECLEVSPGVGMVEQGGDGLVGGAVQGAWGVGGGGVVVGGQGGFEGQEHVSGLAGSGDVEFVLVNAGG